VKTPIKKPDNAGQRLLILSCSKAKRSTGQPHPAIDLYNGPAFRVLRRYISSPGFCAELDVVILSAKHGFISSSTVIAPYDQRMRPGTALAPATLRHQLAGFTVGRSYSNVFVNLGADYVSRLPELRTVLAGSPGIFMAKGRIGEKLHSLKEWLFSS
jgi:hypothetical protein